MFRRLFLLGIFVFVSNMSAFSAYDIVDRYKLTEDRNKTIDMLRSRGRYFLLEVGGAATTEFEDIKNDAEKISKSEGSDLDKFDKAQDFVLKWNNKEHFLRANVGLQIPFFSFWAFGAKVVPNIELFNINMGTIFGMQPDPRTLTAAILLEYIPDDVPAGIQTAIAANFSSYSGGDALVNDSVCTAAGIPLGTACDAVKAEYADYRFPRDVTLPVIHGYAKAEARVLGLEFNIYKDNFFGMIKPYTLTRMDYALKRSADYFITSKKIVPNDWTEQWEAYAMVDLKFGYKHQRYSAFAQIEEIKIATVKESSKKKKELAFGNSPLFRLHGEAKYNFIFLDLVPFAGLHKRSGYGFADGLYAGADAGFSFWNERMGLLARGMVDKNYFTFSPRLTLLFLQLELAAKLPYNDADGVKLASIYSGNVRIFF